MDDPEWHEGGCFCGAQRDRVRGEAVGKGGCTRNTRVKMHAAPYEIWAGFDRANFELAHGALVAFESSPRMTREFCPGCGSTLTCGEDPGGAPEFAEAARIIYIAVASLDDPGADPPDEVVHGHARIDWLHLSDDIPLRESISPSAGQLRFGGIDEADKK